MIRIKSNMPHALNVPFPTARGMPVRTFTIPAAVGGVPGVVELAELDSHTINRLRYHYDKRPVDLKAPDGEHSDIGLLRIEIVDGTPAPQPTRPTGTDPAPVAHAATDLEPPRRTRPAAKAPATPAPGPTKRKRRAA